MDIHVYENYGTHIHSVVSIILEYLFTNIYLLLVNFIYIYSHILRMKAIKW